LEVSPVKRLLLLATSLLLCCCSTAPTQPPTQSKAEFKPKAGDHVLAEWGSETFEEATIKSIEGDKAKVVFGDNSENSVKFPEEVMPIPTAAIKVAPGDYVLGQYPFQKAMWIGGRVNSANGATVNMKFSNTDADSDVDADKVVKAPDYLIPAIKKELGQ
jgi:hypothetical protein